MYRIEFVLAWAHIRALFGLRALPILVSVMLLSAYGVPRTGLCETSLVAKQGLLLPLERSVYDTCRNALPWGQQLTLLDTLRAGFAHTAVENTRIHGNHSHSDALVQNQTPPRDT